MELRQLRYFIKAAETLNFSEAARNLYITQSTLSQQIRQLEDELGIALFMRTSHEVSLTEAGEALLPMAEEILKSTSLCKERVSDLKNLLTGTLRIGVTHTFIPILTQTIKNFMRRYPKVKLDICCKTMEELVSLLEKRELDFVLSFKPTCRYEDIESEILFDNRLSVITRFNHPLASRQSLKLKDIEKYELVMPARGLQARNTFDAIPGVDETDFKVKAELNEVSILMELVRENNLITILSEAAIYNEPFFCAVPLDEEGTVMEGCVHTLKNTYHKRSSKEFIRMLCESDAVKNYQDSRNTQ